MHRKAVITLATESRDQGRMDVQNAVAEVRGDVQQLEETGQANEIDSSSPAMGKDTAAKFFARGTRSTLDNESGDIGLARPCQAERIRFVGDDDSDFRTQQAPADAVEEVLKGGTAAADKDGQPKWIVHGSLVMRM
jgi:hypothetical protein